MKIVNALTRNTSNNPPPNAQQDQLPSNSSSFSAAQRDQIFQLELQSKQLEIDGKTQALAQSRTNNQAYHEARLKALTPSQLPRHKEDDGPNENEFLPPVRKVALSHPGLPRRDVYAIYENKFKPLDLYKLRYHAGRGGDEKKARIIEDMDGMFIFKKKRGLYKDFSLVSKIWSYIFFNYVAILLGYNNITYFFLFEAFFAFHARIIEFSEIYS